MVGFVPKRFWKTVSVLPIGDEFGVMLDDKPLKTSNKSILTLPVLDLAEAVAAEWRLVETQIDKSTMPYTRFAEAAIDAAVLERESIINKLVLYGGNDLICYRADEPEALVARQNEGWNPMMDWAAENGMSLVKTTGIIHVSQQVKSLAAMRAKIEMLSPIKLTALYDLVTLSGSLTIGLAVVDEAIDSNHAWKISRIDEQWQIEQWGPDDEAEANLAPKRRAFVVAGHVIKALPAE